MVGEIRIDGQLHIAGVIVGGDRQLLVNDHGGHGIVEHRCQRRFHALAPLSQSGVLQVPALGLAYIVSVGQNIAPPHGALGKNLHAVVHFLAHNGAVQGPPAVTGAEHGGLGQRHHDQGDVAHTVRRVVPLHIQVAGVCLRAAGNLGDARVLQGDGILPFRLLLFLPAGVLLCLLGHDLFQICHKKYLHFLSCFGWLLTGLAFGGLARFLHALGRGAQGGQPSLDGGDVPDLGGGGVNSPRRRPPLALRWRRATPALW